MASDEIDGLIIRHLADLEAASKRINAQIQPRISSALNKAVERWAEENDWSSGGDFDSDGLWFASSDWQGDSEGVEWASRFWIDAGEEKTPGSDGWEDDYWLSQLCGVGEGTLGVKWMHEFGTKKSQWRRFASDYVVPLRRRGFQYSDRHGFFLLPFRLDPLVMAQSVEDDALEDALQPLTDALDRAASAKGEFERMLAAARQQFGA